jgi:hypothetical protein
MDTALAGAVAAAGLVTLLGSVAGVLLPLFAEWRRGRSKAGHDGRHKYSLVLSIDGKTIAINVSAIDREDPRKIDRAIDAVRATKRVTAAA